MGSERACVPPGGRGLELLQSGNTLVGWKMAFHIERRVLASRLTIWVVFDVPLPASIWEKLKTPFSTENGIRYSCHFVGIGFPFFLLPIVYYMAMYNEILVG